MKNKYSNCAFICNVMNEELYQLSLSIYKDFGIDMIKFNGQSGIYSFNFMNHIITNKEKFPHDFYIFIDEDMFISNKDNLLSLLDYMIDGEYDLCGMPDGGVIAHRFHNPIAINTFLCIMNMKNVRNYYNKDKVINEFFDNDLMKYRNIELTSNRKHKEYKLIENIKNKGYEPYGVTFDNFEPYYKIMFHILRNNGNILYLNAEESNIDGGMTTILKNQNNEDIGYHTWFAREYKTSIYHNWRINNIYNCINKK